MTACALPCFMFTCVPSGKVRLIPDIGSAASAKPSAPSAVTGRERIRDAALYTFVYHYTFAAKSKTLII